MKRKLLLLCALLVLAGCAMIFPSMGADPAGERLKRLLASPQFDAERGQFFNPGRPVSPPADGAMWDFFFNDNETRPPDTLPQRVEDYSKLGDGQQAAFVWFGHSTLLVEIDGQRLLIDPIFSNYASPVPFTIKRFQAPVVGLDELPAVDAVVISHDHYDHLDYRTIKALKAQNPAFIVPLGVGAHLERWGVNPERITELDWWEDTLLGEVRLTSTPAQHFSGRGLRNRNSTLWSSWAITGKKQKLFFSGDSGYGPHYKRIGEQLGPFDFSFLENGAYNKAWPTVHQMPEEAVQASVDLNASAMLAVHWGMFDLSIHAWYEPILRVTAAAQAKEVSLLTPRIGEIVSIGRDVPSDNWWQPLLPESK